MNIFLPLLALAQTTCSYNGKEIPCDQMPGGAGLTFLGVGLFIVMAIVGIAALVFWIKMLIHAIKHPIEHKPLWIIVLLIGGIIGAIIYYFAVKKNIEAAVAAVPITPSAQ